MASPEANVTMKENWSPVRLATPGSPARPPLSPQTGKRTGSPAVRPLGSYSTNLSPTELRTGDALRDKISPARAHTKAPFISAMRDVRSTSITIDARRSPSYPLPFRDEGSDPPGLTAEDSFYDGTEASSAHRTSRTSPLTVRSPLVARADSLATPLHTQSAWAWENTTRRDGHTVSAFSPATCSANALFNDSDVDEGSLASRSRNASPAPTHSGSPALNSPYVSESSATPTPSSIELPTMVSSPLFSPTGSAASPHSVVGSPVAAEVTPLSSSSPRLGGDSDDENGGFTFAAIAPPPPQATQLLPPPSSPAATLSPFAAAAPAASPLSARRTRSSCSPDIWSRPPASPQFSEDADTPRSKVAPSPNGLRRLNSSPAPEGLALRGVASPYHNELYEEEPPRAEQAGTAGGVLPAAGPEPPAATAEAQEATVEARAVEAPAPTLQQSIAAPVAAQQLLQQSVAAPVAAQPPAEALGRIRSQSRQRSRRQAASRARSEHRAGSVATVVIVGVLTLSAFVAALLWLRAWALQARRTFAFSIP